MALDLILDTDIGGDVDDALALALALRHPGFELRAVTTVWGDTVRRAHIAAKLLALAGRDDIEVAAGLSGPHGQAAMMGHEGEGLLEPGETYPLSERDGPTLLVEESADGRCELAVIGTQSNIAAALARDASLPSRVPRLVVMGGMFASIESGGETLSPRTDHNLVSDPDASVSALNAGFATLYVPCDVTFTTALTVEQLERLRRGDALCRALAALVDVWAPILRKLSGGKIPPEHVAVLHDPLTLWCMVDDSFHDSSETRVTVTEHNGAVRTFFDPVAGTPARVVTAVDAPAFSEAFVDCLLES